MLTKKIAVALCVLSLTACQTSPRYRPFPASPPPPLPSSQPVHPYQPVTPPPGTTHPTAPKPALPTYNKPTASFEASNPGRYMDAMEHDLRRILHGVPVGRPGDTLVLNFKSDALFDKGGVLSTYGHNTLQVLAVALRHYDHTAIQIDGFTDTRLSQDGSMKLSQRQADAVAAELRSDGVDARRITATGLGATHLKFATGEGKSEARNRRVEIRIAPHSG